MWSGADTGNDEAQAQSSYREQSDTDMIDNNAEPQSSEYRRNGRERSLSVPCRNEASAVDSVMIKAKRASSYLWMLLHSQVGASM